MRRPVLSGCLSLFAALLAASSPAQISNGFYARANEPQAQTLATRSGETVLLGSNLKPGVLKAELTSRDNSNALFNLRLTIRTDECDPATCPLLVVDGMAYKTASDGSGSDGTGELAYIVSGSNYATQVAGYFNIPMKCRQNPGCNLSVSFTPARDACAIGEEVLAIMRIENTSSNAFAFRVGGRQRAARDNQYNFSAELGGQPVKDIGSGVHFGGLSYVRALKPGEVFTNTVALNKWFAFDKPGTYNVLGSYYLAFYRLNDKGEPDSSLSWWPVWEDYATAPFTVKITP
jgi:hypothetical protein